jgi:SRSO17 transposase
MSVLHKTSNPESTLKKKPNSIAYHLVRESIAMDEMRAGYINTDENYGDLMTKGRTQRKSPTWGYVVHQFNSKG